MNIRELCEKYKISQSGLARRFGIPLRTVQNWCTGQRKAPDYVVNMIGELLQADNRKALYEEAERQCIQSRGKAMREFKDKYKASQDEELGKQLAEGLQRKVEQHEAEQPEKLDIYDDKYRLTRSGPLMTEAELLEHFKAEYRAIRPGDSEFIVNLAAQAAVEQVKRDRRALRANVEAIKEMHKQVPQEKREDYFFGDNKDKEADK